MAIIYTYPLKPVPSLQDSIVITDSADSKKTKITSVQAIIDLLPFVFAENAWNTISFPGVVGAPAPVQAFGPDQTLNLTTGSLVITSVPSAGPGLPSTINIEAPPGDGNIADRDLTFDGDWEADLNGFSWALVDNTGSGNIMSFEDGVIEIGDGNSAWDIPIGPNLVGQDNIYLGGDNGAFTSDHQYTSFDIALGTKALENSGLNDYVTAGWDSNNNENIAIGYGSQELFGTAPTAPIGAIATQFGQNVAIGYLSLQSNTGNTSGLTGADTLGSFNVAIGGQAMAAGNGLTANTAIGHNAALALSTASYNALMGHEVGLQHNDIGPGPGSGYPTTIDLTTGSANVMLGKYTNNDNADNCVIIGDNTSVGTTSIGAAPSSNISIGANSFMPAALSINIGNDNWYDSTGASLVAPVYPAAGGFNDIGVGQIVTIGHQSSFWGNPTTVGVGVAYSTMVGIGQFLYGHAIDAFGNGIQVGVNPANPQDTATAFSADSDNVVVIGNYAYVAGAENVAIGVESFIGGVTYGGTAWEKNVVIGYQAGSNGSFNTAVGESARIESTLGNDILIGSAATINTTNAGFNVVIGCDSNDNGLQANTLVGYGASSLLGGANSIGIGYLAQVDALETVVIGASSNDGSLAGTVTLGSNLTPADSNTLTIGDGLTRYISLTSVSNAAVGTASEISLAGNLDIIGNKTYNAVVPFADPPNILKSDFQQTEFTGQTVTKENFLVNTGATINIDWNEGDVCVIDLNDQPGNVTINAFYNVKPGTYVIRFEQGAAVATPSAVNYPIPGGGAVWKWPGGVPGALTNAVGAEDVLTIHSDGTSLYGVMTNNFL